MTGKVDFWRCSVATAVLLALIGLCPAQLAAQTKPGDVITPQSAGKVQDLVSPGVYWAVQHGMRMNIVRPIRLDWPPPYKEATEKYSAQVTLSADHRSLVGYVAGLPFPLVDANDPYAAVKIMWNFAFQPITSDDYDLRFFQCNSVYVNPGHPEGKIIEQFQIGHYAGYNEVGRVEVEPMPVDPDFKITGRLWLFGLYPVLAPADVRGEGIIRFRYYDANKGDDTWSWLPGARRLRRLNEAMNNTATDAQTFDPDHYNGFDAKIEEYDYKFLGDRAMLDCMNVPAAHIPVQPCPYDGGATSCPQPWEMRHNFVIEATPRRLRFSRKGTANVLDSRNVLFIDSESWYYAYVDSYSQDGRLWRAQISFLAYNDRVVPDARVAIYPFKRQYQVGIALVDVQGGFSTMCYLPGRDTPERECWYINMGAVDKQFFTTQAMVRAAP
jgi:uncharacterized protein DUF1329